MLLEGIKPKFAIMVKTALLPLSLPLFFKYTETVEITLSPSKTVPSSVTAIAASAFYGCKNLAQISIPSSVKTIEVYAFANCPYLTDIYYGGAKSEWKKLDLDIPKKIKIHYNYHK